MADTVSGQASLVSSERAIYIRLTWTNTLLEIEYMEPIVRFQPITTELDPLGEIDEMLRSSMILPVISSIRVAFNIYRLWRNQK